jgi:hypothetical protein
VELVRWSEVSGLAEISAVGNHLVQLGSYRDSQRGLDAKNTEVEASTALEAVTRQQVLKTQQTEKIYYVL